MSDTTSEARALQERILHAMTGEQRLLLAFEMSDATRDFAKAGIRQQHPDWDEARVIRELLRLTISPAELPAKLR